MAPQPHTSSQGLILASQPVEWHLAQICAAMDADAASAEPEPEEAGPIADEAQAAGPPAPPEAAEASAAKLPAPPAPPSPETPQGDPTPSNDHLYWLINDMQLRLIGLEVLVGVMAARISKAAGLLVVLGDDDRARAVAACVEDPHPEEPPARRRRME